jgi:hypothetical protein
VFGSKGRAYLPEPRSGDKVHFDDELECPLVVYQMALPENLQSRDDLVRYYLSRLWPGPVSKQRLDGLVSYLKAGRIPSAARRAILDALGPEAKSVEQRVRAETKGK